MIRRLAAALLPLAVIASAAGAQEPAPRDTVVRDTVRLAPLTSEASRLPSPAARVPAAVSTVSVDEALAGRPAIGLDEVLGGIPGVYVANRYNFALDQRLVIRGFGARAGFGIRGVKVLLDGVPQTLPDGQSQLTNLQPADLVSAEVLRGTASSRFGNASGGVVALRTAPLPAAGTEHDARLVGGAFETAGWYVRTAARAGEFAGGIAFSGLSTAGPRDHDAAELRHLALAGDWLMSGRTTAEVRIRLTDQPLSRNPGAIDLETWQGDRDAAAPNSVTRNARKVVDQQQAALTVRHHTRSGGELTGTTYVLWRDLRNPLATNTIITIDRMAFGLRIDASHPLGRGERAPRLGLGFDAQRMQDDRLNFEGNGAGEPTSVITVDQRETVTEVAPFALLEWSPADRWVLSGGVRGDVLRFEADDHLRSGGVDLSGERDMSALSGHLGASFAPLPGALVYASASTAFETPTTTELANRPDGSGGFNPDLGPQTATTLEAGARGGGPRWHWSAAVFRTRIEDAIVQFLEVGGREYFTNAGRTAHDGVELGLGLEPLAGVVLSSAYTYGDYRFLDYRVQREDAVETLDGNAIPGVPAHTLDLSLAVTRGPVRVEVEQSVRSSMWADDANGIEVAGWGAGVTALRLQGEVVLGSAVLRPFAALENLFDRPYVSAVTVNGFGGRVLEPAPGRHLFLGIEARYRPRAGGIP